MKKEEIKIIEQNIYSIRNSTFDIANDVSSILRVYDETRKQLIITTIEAMKTKIDFLSNEINLIDAKNHFVEA